MGIGCAGPAYVANAIPYRGGHAVMAMADRVLFEAGHVHRLLPETRPDQAFETSLRARDYIVAEARRIVRDGSFGDRHLDDDGIGLRDA